MTANIWSPDSIPGDGSYSAYFDEYAFDATAGQTVINLPFSYTVGMNASAVRVNGIAYERGVDYTETSTTRVTTTRALEAGDRVVVTGGVLVNPSMPPDAVSAAALAAGSGAGLVGTADGRTLQESLDQVINDVPSAQFDIDVPIYNPNETGLSDAANVIDGTSAGTHTKARVLWFTKLTVSGSGAASGPARADFVGADVLFKSGWPILSTALPGEMNCRQFAFRQTNGDATFFLGNGQINNGFGAVYEARVESIDEAGIVQQSVNVQTGVINDDADTPGNNFERGYRALKVAGSGGVAISADHEAGAEWLYQYGAFDQGVPWWYVDGADGSHLFFQDGAPSSYVRAKAGANNTWVLTDPLGANVASFERTATSYSPTIGATVGSITTSSVSSAVYRRSGKRVEGRVEVLITDIGTASGALTITTPSTPAAFYDPVTGFNANTAQALTGAVIPSSAVVRVYLYTGAFPVASGHTIGVRFVYEEA